MTEKNHLLMMLFSSTTITMLMILLTLIFVNNNKKNNKNNNNPFECGFNSNNMIRNSFSFRFIKILIVFLLFDLEMNMILPMPIIFINMFTQKTMIILLFMMTLFFFTTIIEMKQKTFNWYI